MSPPPATRPVSHTYWHACLLAGSGCARCLSSGRNTPPWPPHSRSPSARDRRERRCQDICSFHDKKGPLLTRPTAGLVQDRSLLLLDTSGVFPHQGQFVSIASLTFHTVHRMTWMHTSPEQKRVSAATHLGSVSHFPQKDISKALGFRGWK